MPIIYAKDVPRVERWPGVLRWERVSGARGAKSLVIAQLEYTPGSRLVPHTHPNEEAMLILGGTLEAVLGDETCTVKAGDTVLAPTGVRHGFTNRSSENAYMVAVHPVPEVVMQWEEQKRS